MFNPLLKSLCWNGQCIDGLYLSFNWVFSNMKQLCAISRADNKYAVRWNIVLASYMGAAMFASFWLLSKVHSQWEKRIKTVELEIFTNNVYVSFFWYPKFIVMSWKTLESLVMSKINWKFGDQGKTAVRDWPMTPWLAL
jgi:hypothetical protein